MNPEGYVEPYDICHEISIQKESFQPKKRWTVIGNSGSRQKRKQKHHEVSIYDETDADTKGMIYTEQEAGSFLYELNPKDFPKGEKRRKIQKAINSHRHRQKIEASLSAVKAKNEEKIRNLEEQVLALTAENFQLKKKLELCSCTDDALFGEATEVNLFDFSFLPDVSANFEEIERLTWPLEEDSQTV